MRLIKNIGADRVLDQIAQPQPQPHLQPGARADAASDGLSLFAFDALASLLGAPPNLPLRVRPPAGDEETWERPDSVLKQRVSGRMVLLDISATGEENLIERDAGNVMQDLAYRRKQLQKLQEAVIDLEDLASASPSPT